MNRPLAYLALTLCCATVSAQSTQQALSSCSNEAQSKGLSGDERKLFMRECIRKNVAPTVQKDGHAPPPSTKGPLYTVVTDGVTAQMVVMRGKLSYEVGKTDDFAQALADLRATGTQLDADIPVAVKQARGNADLVKALKEYYAAGSAFIGAGIPTTPLEKHNSDRLSAEMDAKQKSLDLELKLAGK